MPLERGFDGPGPAVRRKKPGMRLLALQPLLNNYRTSNYGDIPGREFITISCRTESPDGTPDT
ncbi:hypothetical protein HNQ38_000421 [Desulfovibrio intestinalis]|uniref:Uncharacterized protein n=1 Tax=Desulfovibrio intestinalis TaxID=58621 RepID=A0A7W8BYK8_9BACT|nr:hypothetical protein [Desulfovibrio intestinalis]